MNYSQKISERLWNISDKGVLESKREQTFIDDIVQKNHISLAGPGAFARTVPKEILKKIMLNEKQKRDFLEFSYKFDKNQYVCGLGKDNLLVYGELE